MPSRYHHEPGEALAALSLPNERTPGGLSRRTFLSGLGAAGALAALGGTALRPRAARAAGDGARKLVVLYLSGGNDGFATILPRAPHPIDQLRPGILWPRAQLLPIDADWGFHPSLKTLRARYDAGQVAIVGGVGPSNTLSHFDAARDWFTGSPDATGGPDAGTGWLGRWLDTLGPGTDQPLRCVSITGAVPQLLVGRTTAGLGMGLRASALLGAHRTTPLDLGLFQAVEGWGASVDPATARGRYARVGAAACQLAGTIGSVYASPLPGPDSQAKGVLAARLLNSEAWGCDTVFMDLAPFDNHADEFNAQTAILGQLDTILKYFYDTLHPTVSQRTTVLVFSEFGRRPQANGSGGTDHGTASYAFLVGPPVKGGLYGGHLDPTVRDANGNPPVTVRHLDLIGSVLSGWLGADADAIVGTATTDLGLFR